jgi:hypothetical protein
VNEENHSNGDETMAGKQRQSKVEGEGSYTAAKQYNEGLRKSVKSGTAEAAARRAAPSNPAEAAEMEAAERAGKRRAKEEDPALKPGAPRPSRSK